MRVRTVLYADDGMVLTDGTTYGKVIWLAEGVDPAGYSQITEAQLAQMEVMGDGTEC